MDWYNANPERVAEQDSRQPERRAETWTAWYRANRDRHIEQTAAYQKANPDKVRAWATARFARTRGSLTAEQFTLDEIFERDEAICYLCRELCPRERASMDHVIPTCAPHHGSHTRDNVKLAHLGCNSRKGRRLLHELAWYTPPKEPP